MISKKSLRKKTKPLPRPPVVAVLGHIDHGKTTLLSALKKIDLTRKEYGGITQHIGAYQIKTDKKSITFIDTPGHEAFTAMRARGGQASDIVLLVVAANDGVMPQTIEAINHAKVAKVPIIVVINKIDLSAANPKKARQQLAEAGVMVEDWGGDVVCVEVSAKEKKNLDLLLEMILLVAEMEELKANPKAPFEGIIIESKLDPQRGPLASILVKNGTLKIGTEVLAEKVWGKVKAMTDDKGQRLKEAYPSTPVEVLGLRDVPPVGAVILEGKVKEEPELKKPETPKKLAKKAEEEETEGIKVLNLVLKADAEGTLEAIKSSLLKLGEKDFQITILHSGTGEVSKSDVLLASSAEGKILAFNVKTPPNVKYLAKTSGVEIRTYNIIYKLLEDTERALKGLLEEEEEKIKGRFEVLATFSLPSGDLIAGGKVTGGKLKKGNKIKVLRETEEVWKAKIKNLKIKKETVLRVEKDKECGILLSPQFKVKKGDIIEVV